MNSSTFTPSTSMEVTPQTLSATNGVLTESLSITDRGTHYGHGLFETMLCSGGNVPLWPLHKRRLMRDAVILGLRISEKTLDENLNVFLSLLEDHSISNGIIKLIATAGSGGRGYVSPKYLKPRIICQHSPLPENLDLARQEGIVLTQCEYRLPPNPMLAGIKHLNRLDQILARSEWGDNYVDGVMYNQDNFLIETTCANIFVRSANGWETPELDKSGVRGVMRNVLIETLFPQAELKVVQTYISEIDLGNALEVFVCSSIRGIVPVTEINCFAHWAIGSDTKRLQSMLSDHYDCYPC